MSKQIILLVLFNFICFIHYGQQFSISGFIQDASSRETIIGAIISNGKEGTSSNSFGRFSFNVKKGKQQLVIQYFGYKTKFLEFTIEHDTTVNILMERNELKEVVIKNKKDKVSQEYTSVTSIPMAQLKSVPAVGGEADIMKAIQHTPGIQGGVEGSAGVYVRGGSPDQNLILLDDVPVYNINHLFGYVSVFTPDAVKNFEIYKGGFPARYGGRLSSVMDVRMKEGNMKNLNGLITISPIASTISFEGPLKKDKSSFMIAARRTWLDGIAYLISKSAVQTAGADGGGIGLNFYDITAKTNYIFNKNNRLYLSFYAGNDKFNSSIKSSENSDSSTVSHAGNQFIKWGNITTSLRYNKSFKPNLFGNATFAFTQYKFQTGSNAENTFITKSPYSEEKNNASLKYNSSIKDIILKYDFEYHVANWNTVRAGVNHSSKQFLPGVFISGTSTNNTSIDTSINNQVYSNSQTDIYIEENIKPASFFNINLGLRYEMFHAKSYQNKSLQPRVNVNVMVNKKLSIKASYAGMSQGIHLLSNSGTGLPTDLWLPATSNAPVERSQQLVLGVYKNVNNLFDISIEGYYKSLHNVLEYKEGASFLGTFTGWEDKVEIGKGNVKGLEFFLHKKEGKLNGWIGYTLSFNNRTFPTINSGQTFPYRYDRRHVFDIFASYQMYKTEEKERTISAVWQYSTGNSITLPTQIHMGTPNEPSNQYTTFSNILDGFGEQFNATNGIISSPSRNNYRMRAQHRLDITYSSTKKKEWGERTWNFTIYNLYARRNPYYVYIYKPVFGDREKYVERSMFSIFPSISYSIKFDAKQFFYKKYRAEKYYE